MRGLGTYNQHFFGKNISPLLKLLLNLSYVVTFITLFTCRHMRHTAYRSDLYDQLIVGEVLLRFWGSTMPKLHEEM